MMSLPHCWEKSSRCLSSAMLSSATGPGAASTGRLQETKDVLKMCLEILGISEWYLKSYKNPFSLLLSELGTGMSALVIEEMRQNQTCGSFWGSHPLLSFYFPKEQILALATDGLLLSDNLLGFQATKQAWGVARVLGGVSTWRQFLSPVSEKMVVVLELDGSRVWTMTMSMCYPLLWECGPATNTSPPLSCLIYSPEITTLASQACCASSMRWRGMGLALNLFIVSSHIPSLFGSTEHACDHRWLIWVRSSTWGNMKGLFWHSDANCPWGLVGIHGNYQSLTWP